VKKTVFRTLASIVLAGLMTGGAAAQTMFIDDTLYVPVRAGEGSQYRIVHQGLRSGTPVEVIEEDPDSDYVFIRFGDDEEGYIPRRFLTEERIAAQRLAETSQELNQTRETLSEVREELQSRESELTDLRERETQLEGELEEVSGELTHVRDVSEDAININERNEELRTEMQELQKEVELLTTENQRLKDRKDSDFLLMGGALVIAGIFIAVIFPLLKPSRKTESWN